MKSKFKIGQKVWYIRFDSVKNAEVSGIIKVEGTVKITGLPDIKGGENDFETHYYIESQYDVMKEANLFATKEGLMSHLFEDVKEGL